MKAFLHVLKPPRAAEYARSLATYHEQRIKRLKAYLHEHHAKEKQDDPTAG